MSDLSAKTIHSRQASKKAPNKKPTRQATLYDAVAGTAISDESPVGRVSSTGFIPPTPRISSYRDTPSSSSVPVPPEEVLFRRKAAPIRYEEDDFYWADRYLTDSQKLPESDLLKAIHAYASEFYGRAVKGRGKVDFESLDETALLAMGILMEETAGEVLGETGYKAFVEGEDDRAEGAEEGASVKEATSSGEEHLETATMASQIVSEEGTSEKEVGNTDKRRRKRKRRKIRHIDDGRG